MKFLTKTLYWLSIIIVCAIAILAWIFIGWQIGIAGLMAIPAFALAYSLSEKAVVSRRDKYTRSEWGLFCKKMSWAWSAALVVYGVGYIITAYCFGDPMDVLPK